MNKSRVIRCAECEYARQDKNASVYGNKHCRSCERWADCEICRGCKKADECKARQSRKRGQSCKRRRDIVCSQQALKWSAIECANPDSEYHRALLNVTPSGEKQERVTWAGCPHGERRCGV